MSIGLYRDFIAVETRSPKSVILPSVLLLDWITLDTVPFSDLDLAGPEKDDFADFSFRDFDLYISELGSSPVDAILLLDFSVS